MELVDRSVRSFQIAVAFAFAAAFAAATSAHAQTTTRVSVDSSGNQVAGECAHAVVSADGRYVAFDALSSQLVPNDTNGLYDVFVHDRWTGTTERISVDSNGIESDGNSGGASFSADGRYVAFSSNATNLVANDWNGNENDVFVHDRLTGTTELVSVDSYGSSGDEDSGPGMISADGRFVVFESFARNLVPLDNNNTVDVFVRDLVNGTTERVSVDASGTEGNGESRIGAISGNGQVVVFQSDATNLVGNDLNGVTDVFCFDRGTGTLTRLSVDPAGNDGNDRSYEPVISTDGAIVAFTSGASNLVAGDVNAKFDVFVRDRGSNVTELASVNFLGVEGDDFSISPALNADGSLVAFVSIASNLVAHTANVWNDVYVHDRIGGSTKRMSVDSAGVEGSYVSYGPSLSANGHFVAFGSYSSNLVANDTNGKPDIFVHERPGYASWSNYGVGFPGNLGIPAFTASADPILGTTVTVDLGNSNGAATFGLLVVGLTRAEIHSSFGGDLLVAPLFTIAIPVPAGGAAFPWTVPSDPSLTGLGVDLQTLEADVAAAKGVSFTAGLELVLGR